MHSNYQEFALLLTLSALVGVIALRLRQPLLMAYIIVGILVGPAALGWVGAHDQIDLMVQLTNPPDDILEQEEEQGADLIVLVVAR